MLLRIRKLSKTYTNGVEALKEITLTIPRGALVQTAETSA
jgi:ABC-type phosphate/phosphonate transport system ATPase subunit